MAKIITKENTKKISSFRVDDDHAAGTVSLFFWPAGPPAPNFSILLTAVLLCKIFIVVVFPEGSAEIMASASVFF